MRSYRHRHLAFYLVLLGIGSFASSLAQDIELSGTHGNRTFYLQCPQLNIVCHDLPAGQTFRVFTQSPGSAAYSYKGGVTDQNNTEIEGPINLSTVQIDLRDIEIGQTNSGGFQSPFTVYLCSGGTSFDAANVLDSVTIGVSHNVVATKVDTSPNYTYQTGNITVNLSYNGELGEGVDPHDYNEPGSGGGGDPEPDEEFFAVGFDLTDDFDPPSPQDTIDMLIEAAGVPGSGINKQVLTAQIKALGANPRVVLEGVQLANGDKITFTRSDGETQEGFIESGIDGKMLWTPGDVRILNTYQIKDTDPNTGESVTKTRVVSSKTSPNGTVKVINADLQWDENGQPILGEATVFDWLEQAELTRAEEQAAAQAAADAAQQEGITEGKEAFDGASQQASDSLAEAGEKLKGATNNFKDKLDGYDPMGSLNVGTISSYQVTVPIATHVVTIEFPIDHPGFQILRSVVLFIVSVSGVRMFFRILIV